MCFTRKFKVAGLMLIAAACLVQNTGSAANTTSRVSTQASRLQSKFKATKAPNRIRRPRITGMSGSTAKTAKTKQVARRQSPAQNSATALRITEPKRAKLKPAVSRLAIDPAKVRAAKSVKVDGLKNTGLREVASGAGVSAAGPKQTNYNGIALRAGTIQTQESVESIGANSSTFKAIESVMPGFSARGAQGASSLKDLGSQGGRQRNPVTSAGGLSDFAGGGSDQVSDGGASIKVWPDGSSVANVDGGDGNQSTVTTKIPGTGTLVINPDDSREYHLDNGTSIYYDSNGNRTMTVTTGSATVTSSKGTKGEPVDDATGSGGSGNAVVTAETLRGLNSRVNSKGEPTGDEGTSGGAVDQSKTRQGKINQVGQPTEDGVSVRTAPTGMEVNQALRVRLRNVTPTIR